MTLPTTELPPPPNPRALLREAGLGAKKSWGQNFLCDQRVLAGIADATVRPERHPVLELGAGLGALTYYLVQRHPLVIAIERDRDIAPLLRESLAWAPALQVREADAATLDYPALHNELGAELIVAGNLPYQIASRLLVELANHAAHIVAASVLIQREVAQRLVAPPGSRTYGLLSVLVGRSFAVRILRHVSPGAFFPAPKVTSSVVQLERHTTRRSRERDDLLVATARAAFASRRKTLRNALAGALGTPAPAIEAALRAHDFDPGLRAEVLGIDELERLGVALHTAGIVTGDGVPV